MVNTKLNQPSLEPLSEQGKIVNLLTKEVKFGQLQAAQATAVSQQRKESVKDQIESNNIKMSNQTYNPYHLSSYKPDFVITERSEMEKPSPGRRRFMETVEQDAKRLF